MLNKAHLRRTFARQSYDNGATLIQVQIALGHLYTDDFSNHLLTLPDSFGNLSNLAVLDLGGNSLTTLPDSFGNLTNLAVLDLGDNSLITQPDSFGNLTNLQP